MLEHGSWTRTAAATGLLKRDGTIAETIFAEMSALAARTGAINLGQGFPDEDGPVGVLEAARDAIARGDNQYPPGRGVLELRSAIAEHQSRFYGLAVDPDREVVVTAGATEALAATLLAVLEPDDEVVTFEPYYDAYAGLVALAGARLVTVPLSWPEFRPDHERMTEAVTDRTRVILVNNPHNPTGAVFGRETLEHAVSLAERHDALIVTDEVYEHLTFGVDHPPIAALPGARERTVTISSGGKTFNTTGWKVGWLCAPADIAAAVLTVKQFLTYAGGAPFQPAIAAGLRLSGSFFTELAADLARKRDILTDGLRRAGFETSTPRGSYFVVTDAASRGFADATEFCRVLPDRAGVVAVPISAFVSDANQGSFRSLVRFAFCKQVPTLERAAAQLADARF